MKARIILSIIIIALGAITALFPQIKNKSGVPNAKQLLKQFAENSHMLEADDIAKAIISQDPSIQLIDVRTAEEYNKFSLPGAINIPLDSILTENSLGLLDISGKRNIYYSTGTVISGQAVILTRSLGYKNTFLLRGGLNNWYETIINPDIPDETASLNEKELYESRLGASLFFTGTKVEAPTASVSSSSAIPSAKKKKSKVQGGCG